MNCMENFAEFLENLTKSVLQHVIFYKMSKHVLPGFSEAIFGKLQFPH